MSNEITFDQIKVGDRIKAREVYKNGDTFEGEVTAAEREPDHRARADAGA